MEETTLVHMAPKPPEPLHKLSDIQWGSAIDAAWWHGKYRGHIIYVVHPTYDWSKDSIVTSPTTPQGKWAIMYKRLRIAADTPQAAFDLFVQNFLISGGGEVDVS